MPDGTSEIFPGREVTVSMIPKHPGKLTLPRIQWAEPAAANEVEGGSETILVVEDDQLVRGYVSAQLAHLGYRTVVAASGPEALAQIDKGLAFVGCHADERRIDRFLLGMRLIDPTQGERPVQSIVEGGGGSCAINKVGLCRPTR